MGYVEYVFPGCSVLVDEEQQYIETRFPDGTKVPAAPNIDNDSVYTAWDLGYEGDTWAMTRDHELAHTWLAFLAGHPHSPVLWRVAHEEGLSEDWVREEEARVLEWQRGFDKGEHRPWDLSVDIPRMPSPW